MLDSDEAERLKYISSHWLLCSLLPSQRFEFSVWSVSLYLILQAVTRSHTQSHLEGEKMCVCVCDKLPCDWHYSRLSHYVTTHFLFPLSLFFVSVFMSLCVTKCLIRVMAAWGGKFPLWFRKYNSTNNIPSDKSHPACAEVCVCLRLWVQPMHVSVTTCLCMLILYLQKYRQ